MKKNPSIYSKEKKVEQRKRIVLACWNTLKLMKFVVVKNKLFVLKTLLLISWCKGCLQ
jgi:hypothetical protein